VSEREALLWYVAYGSNLLLERFACYILGGKAPGATRRNHPARDPSPPRAEAATFLDRPLRFAGHSAAWQGGGVAFVDPRPDPRAQTLARRYLVTREQFEDVLRQENADPEATCDLAALAAADGAMRVSDGAYGLLLGLGEVEGVPLVTCTHPDPETGQEPNGPSKPYLQCVIAGLRQTYHLNHQGVVRYLGEVPGIRGRYPGPALRKAFDAADVLVAE